MKGKADAMVNKEIIGNDKFDNAIILGKILRAWRERQGILQKEVCEALGYKNSNYISMLEAGRTSVPVGRIADVVEAYKIDPEFALAILKGLYPEYFDMVLRVVELTNVKNRADGSQKADALVRNLIEKFNIRLAS
jgi:transcriptional regulator with XRE-family HTH domain